MSKTKIIIAATMLFVLSSCGSGNNEKLVKALAEAQAQAQEALARVEAAEQRANSSTNGNVAASSSATKSVESPDDGIPTIGARELLEAYSNNEVAAAKKYKGKTYNISGIIDGFSTGVFDEEPIVELDAGILLTISCHFPHNAEDIIASLSKGQKVIIQGTIDDFMLGVDVKNCKLIKN